MDTDAEHSCGDVNHETINSIWKRRNENFVKYHLTHDWNCIPKFCRNCNDWMVVGEQKFDENGNIIIKNYKKDSEMH